MASKQTNNVAREDLFGGTVPKWPTTVKSRLLDGRMVGVGNSGVWLYKKVPLSAVQDAKTLSAELAASDSLMGAFSGLSAMTSLRGVNRRSMVRANYREVHQLLVNVPQWFTPPPQHPLRDDLISDYDDETVEQRILLFGVRLRDSIVGKGGWRDAVDSVMETLVSGGTPLSDYDADFAAVDAVLGRAGLLSLSQTESNLANAWFNHGMYTDPVTHPGIESLAVFTRPSMATYARQHLAKTPINEWPQRDGYHVVSFGAVQDLNLDFTPSNSGPAAWAAGLVDAGAMAVSIRGLIEPASVTRKEIEAQQKRYQSDLADRQESGKLSKAEQEEQHELLARINDMYGTGNAPPTLVDASIVVGFNGHVSDMEDVMPPGSPVLLNPMTNRQPAALAETWLCSAVEANPHRLDIPVTSIAYSGIVSLSRVGDAPREGAALLGFTERDRQPAWFNPKAAYSLADSPPLFLVAGASGSGKTLLLQLMADQIARAGSPVVVIDPKVGSDLSPAMGGKGNQTVSLDELLSADGVFDPLRFGASPETAVELAASTLLEVNPWGSRLEDFEVPLQVALAYGVDQGATCTGQALQIALDDKKASSELVDPVMALAGSNTQFRAVCGIDPTSQPLRAAEGITYIRVGDANLTLPEPGTVMPTLTQRIAVALLRLMVSGSAMALTGREGVVFFDEAWVFMGAGNTELERLARVARSQSVTVVMLTQRVSDATVSGINEHVSGGVILHLNESEAEAACQLLGISPTMERIRRITAKGTMGEGEEEELAPNPDSFRPLYRTGTREVVRGAIAFYADMHNRVVPIEIVVPKAFLARASTNAQDISARERADRLAKEHKLQAELAELQAEREERQLAAASAEAAEANAAVSG